MSDVENDRGQTSITDFYAATFRKATTAGGDRGGKSQQHKPKAAAKKVDREIDVGAPPGSADALAQTRTLLLQRLEHAMSYAEARGSAIAGVCQPLQPSNRKSVGEVVTRRRVLPQHLEQLPSILAPTSTDELDVRVACQAVAAASRAFAKASMLPIMSQAQQKPCSPPSMQPTTTCSPSAATPASVTSVSPSKTPQQRQPPQAQQQPAPAAAAARPEAGKAAEGDKKKGGKRTASQAALAASDDKSEAPLWDKSDVRGAPACKRRAKRAQHQPSSDTGFGVPPQLPAAPAQLAAAAPPPASHAGTGGGGMGAGGGGNRRHVLVERQLRLKQQAQDTKAAQEQKQLAGIPSSGHPSGGGGGGGRGGGGGLQFRRAGEGGGKAAPASMLSFADGSSMMMHISTPFGAGSKPSPSAPSSARMPAPQQLHAQAHVKRGAAPQSPLTIPPETPRTMVTPKQVARTSWEGEGEEPQRHSAAAHTPVFPDDMARAMIAKPTSDSGGSGGEGGASLYCFEQLATSAHGSPLLETLFGAAARAAPLSSPPRPVTFSSPSRLDGCRTAHLNSFPINDLGIGAAICALSSPIRDPNSRLVSPFRNSNVGLVSPIRDSNVMRLFSSSVPSSPLPPLQTMHPENSYPLAVEAGD